MLLIPFTEVSIREQSARKEGQIFHAFLRARVFRGHEVVTREPRRARVQSVRSKCTHATSWR